MPNENLRVAIIGSGNIGTDLLYKLRRINNLKCVLMVGRRENSVGLGHAKRMGINTSSKGLEGLLENISNIDLVFDATSAIDHVVNSEKLRKSGVAVINLTPAPLGDFYVPLVSSNELAIKPNVHLNMVTCGGQTTIPLISALASEFQLSAVEVVSTIASNSAGLATRENLDEYILNTERAITSLTGVQDVKVMLMINPAVPEITMNTSIYISGEEMEKSKVETLIHNRLIEMSIFNPGISLVTSPSKIIDDVIHFSVQVVGSGDFLPKYAGNLDIINVAAIRAALEVSTRVKSSK
jgi:acetaldehyde dehydrogenase (acetylating)